MFGSLEKLQKLTAIMRPCMPDDYRPMLDRLLCLPSTIIYEMPPLKAVWVATNVRPGGIADVHVSIQDKALLRQPDLGREALGMAFNDYGVHKFQAIIRSSHRIAIAYALALGFKQEGVHEQIMRYNNKWVDATICGLLRKDF